MQKSIISQSPIHAGVAKVDITPPYGTIINGDFLPRYAREIHDPLYVKALAFSDGKQQFVFVLVDNMTLDAGIINDAKESIRNLIGLKPGQIMIAATHAHSCGSVIETGTCMADLAYRSILPGKIAEAVKLAFEYLQPAKIAWGNVDVINHVSCRRWYMKQGFDTTNPFGGKDKVWMNPPFGSKYLDRPVSVTDPQVSYLAVKSIKGKWISLLGNYSTHYVADVPPDTISADYFGEFDLQLKAKLKADDSFVGIMSNGTSGDVNTFDFRQRKNYPTGFFEKSKLIADDITTAIIVSLKKASWVTTPAFKMAMTTISVGTRKPSQQLLAKSKILVKNTDFASLNTTDKASDAFARLYALEILKLDYYQQSKLFLPLQSIRLGDGTIGTLPGEFFSETGLNLKKMSPSKFYFSISLANAMIGYVPPASEFDLGGYETWLCSGSYAAKNAEQKITAELLKLILSVQ